MHFLRGEKRWGTGRPRNDLSVVALFKRDQAYGGGGGYFWGVFCSVSGHSRE